jgi:hypothetical protein
MRLPTLLAPTREVDPDDLIDPRVMWPLHYLTFRLGYRVVPAGRGASLTGDLISVELERDHVRVRVTWVPRTEQIFVTRGSELLGVHGSFPELAAALDALTGSACLAA